MVKGISEIPGKIVLIGEHAVVYGHPAIAIPLRSVSARAEVSFARTPGIDLVAADLNEHVLPGTPGTRYTAPLVKVAEAVMELFGEGSQGVRIVLESTIPIGRGMGSGAAVSVAIAQALCKALGRKLNAEQICELADIAEKDFHGSPSGIDSRVVALNAPVYFVQGRPAQSIAVGASEFHFLVADTGVEASTIEVVGDVREARDKDRATYDSYFWEIGSLASVAHKILKSGSPLELGLCMNRSHSALRAIGVSSPELDRLVAVAMEQGALGAKLSGAGRGGAMIVLLRDPADEDRIAAELSNAGAESIFSTTLNNN